MHVDILFDLFTKIILALIYTFEAYYDLNVIVNNNKKLIF